MLNHLLNHSLKFKWLPWLPQLLVVLLSVALLPASAYADEVTDVNQLVQTGQYVEALSKANDFIDKRPQSAPMRFLKGVILAEQNRTSEAISVFTKLTEQFPDLPEPYNNLAVLHAANGQYEKARTILDMALRTNPSYATVYDNLGDLHAKLAIQAYDKALQIDSGNNASKSKLALLPTLNNNNGINHASPTARPPLAPISVNALPAKPNQPSLPITVIKPEAKPETKPEPKPEPKSESQTEKVEPQRNEILGTVTRWAKAWSSQDVKGYLGFYSDNFQTPNGQGYKEWAEDRRARINGKSRINVQVESPTITIDGNTATVKFRQIYTSDRLTANSRKTLILTKQNGKWQIKQERTGN